MLYAAVFLCKQKTRTLKNALAFFIYDIFRRISYTYLLSFCRSRSRRAYYRTRGSAALESRDLERVVCAFLKTLNGVGIFLYYLNDFVSRAFLLINLVAVDARNLFPSELDCALLSDSLELCRVCRCRTALDRSGVAVGRSRTRVSLERLDGYCVLAERSKFSYGSGGFLNVCNSYKLAVNCLENSVSVRAAYSVPCDRDSRA